MESSLEAQTRDVLSSLQTLGIALGQAAIIIVVARMLHRYVRGLLIRRLDSPNLSESGRTMITVMSSIVVGLASATILLALWGVTWAGILTAISLGTLGILLGIQDVLKSLIGGVFLVLEKPYAIGDRVKVRDVTGRIIGIELRTTIMRSDTGHRIVAPNSIVFTDTITNFSLRRHVRTTLVMIGVTEKPAEVRAMIEEAMGKIEGIEGTPEVRFRAHRSRLPEAVRKGLSDSALGDRVISRGSEARISWLGGGEPEVQSAVIAKLRTIFPNATIRVNKMGR